MREILFKAKRKDNGEWVEGSLVTYPNDVYEIWDIKIGRCCLSTEHFKVIPETICEYTGIKDKNSKKIFENDEVKYKYIGEDGEEKEYIPKIGVMNFKKNGWHINSKWLDSFTMNMFDFEVIGNIFDEEVK